MTTAEKIARIKDKLDELRTVDSDFYVFGAQFHKYTLNKPKTEAELVAFEQANGISLPSEYREFLKTMGNGGAGPYYGLEKLESGRFPSLDRRDENNLIDLSAPFPHTDHWNIDSGGVNEDDEEAYEKWSAEYNDKKWASGLLRLSNFGCGVYISMVVNGPEHGNIWADDRMSEQGIYPDPYSGKQGRVQFLDWYEAWLDSAIAEAKAEEDEEDDDDDDDDDWDGE